MNKIVIGLGYGDEGKGLVTDYLCSQSRNPLVVRFSGGHQAGHMVHYNGIRHVFSNFGSGTLRGVPTYWSKNCTVDPFAVLNEYELLRELGVNPILYIDSQCPITTPFDKYFNQTDSTTLGHGSCGVGFGATIEREESNHHLKFSDLYNETVLKIKIELIRQYYNYVSDDANIMIDEFIDDCKKLITVVKLGMPVSVGNYELIYEGSQGILLDKDIGFFPHVTRSNTTSINIRKWDNVTYKNYHLYLVTRAYQTRHGNGPMTNEHMPHNIKLNPTDTNKDHPYQGRFRRSILDLDLLSYAVSNEPSIGSCQVTLVITCLDHVENEWKLTKNGNLMEFDTEDEFVKQIQESVFGKHIEVIRVRSDKSELVGV